MKLTLNIFHDDTHLYEVCVCLNQNQISISCGLLKAVSIVMANEQRGFHRFFLSTSGTVVSFYVLLFVPCAPLLAASMATSNELLHIHQCTLCVCPSVRALTRSVLS